MTEIRMKKIAGIKSFVIRHSGIDSDFWFLVSEFAA